MKKSMSKISIVLMAICLLFCGKLTARAEETVKSGIYAGAIDLSGMTAEEAKLAVQVYVDGLKEISVTLVAAVGNQVQSTAGDFGIRWANPELVDEAMELGASGNIIQRYKAARDLEHENKIYPIKLDFDYQMIGDYLSQYCSRYDVRAEDVSLTRENGEFQIRGGQTGYILDVERSIDLVHDFLVEEWDHNPCTIELDVTEESPRGTAEDMAQVRDVLGTFTTSYSTSGSSRSANVENGCRLINSTTLYPGDEFSTYETVSPFSAANGYYMAGSYINGKVVDSIGGGICQVSTTLYNAVLQAELEVTERHNHSMIVSYVDPSADAAIAESAGKDFRFVNNLDYPIYIEGYTKGKKITFTIYSKETRDPNHKVRYESKVLEVKHPETDNIYPDGSQPIGYISTQSAHIGYKAELWKVVTENGVETERTKVNSSSYKMMPRSATVGTATDNPAAYEEIMAAIGTGSIDHVKNVIALLTTAPAPVE